MMAGNLPSTAAPFRAGRYMSVASLTPSRMAIIASLPARTSYRAWACAWSGETPASRASGGKKQRSNDRPAKAARKRGVWGVIEPSLVNQDFHFGFLAALDCTPRRASPLKTAGLHATLALAGGQSGDRRGLSTYCSEHAGGNGRLAFRTRGLPSGRKNLRDAGLGAGRLRRVAADPRAAGGDGGRRAGGILSGSRRGGATRRA